jgi:clostripain
MEDLNEMEHGLYLASLGDSSITDKIKIIVQVDRSSGYDNSAEYTGENWSDTRRYIIRPDPANSGAWTSQRIDNDLGEVNMGDANNLAGFVEYCKEHFPAPNYSLILWNHGGGLKKKSASSTISISDNGKSSSVFSVKATGPSKEICIDETDGDDALYTGEITDVLTDIHSVDFLGFDACLMGMIEVAYEYRPGVSGKFGADAICYSPASEQGDGWNYEKILNRLKGSGTDDESDLCYDADSLTANQFAEIVAKEYADDDSTYGDNTQTQTAVDNTKVAALKTALDAFAVAYSTASTLETQRDLTMHYFDESSVDELINIPFYDLYDFAERMNGTSANAAATSLMNAIKVFILYSYGGSSYSGFTAGQNGLSFFFTDGDNIYKSKPYIAYQWWYTSVDSNVWWPGGHYYGNLDFCDGNDNGTVETWFERLMKMYRDTGLTQGYHPGPGY